ncbi:TPA: FKBP-type peptidyl-prolyl cis-trans isomerase, partial [Pseudomonas aeruginosa]
MPRRLFIGLFLLPLPLFAAPPKDELAYAVGARLGMRLQQEMPGLELSELLLGLRQ